MRPIDWVFSRPIDFQVRPPSTDLKTPPPGEIELRELGSPVPAHTCIESLGAIASTPIETTFWLSNTGRQVTPLLIDFQIPPAAAATKRLLEGDGSPVTSETRPIMLAGPTFLHRKPATVW